MAGKLLPGQRFHGVDRQLAADSRGRVNPAPDEAFDGAAFGEMDMRAVAADQRLVRSADPGGADDVRSGSVEYQKHLCLLAEVVAEGLHRPLGVRILTVPHLVADVGVDHRLQHLRVNAGVVVADEAAFFQQVSLRFCFFGAFKCRKRPPLAKDKPHGMAAETRSDRPPRRRRGRSARAARPLRLTAIEKGLACHRRLRSRDVSGQPGWFGPSIPAPVLETHPAGQLLQRVPCNCCRNRPRHTGMADTGKNSSASHTKSYLLRPGIWHICCILPGATVKPCNTLRKAWPSCRQPKERAEIRNPLIALGPVSFGILKVCASATRRSRRSCR